MAYVDGYVLPIRKAKLPIYRRIARKAGKAWRDGGVLLDRVQVPRPSRQRERQGDEGPATREADGGGGDALRRQAHGLRRLQGSGGRVGIGRSRFLTCRATGRLVSACRSLGLSFDVWVEPPKS